MTDSIDVLIQAALCDRLKTPDMGVPIAWPMVRFSPVPGVPFLEVHSVMRLAPQSPSLDFAGSSLFRGIFQVDAVVPDGAGEAPGLRIAGLVAARFAIGTTFVAGTNLVKCNSLPTIAAAVKDAPWVRFPVSIPYLLID